jgi:hypothetical protein
MPTTVGLPTTHSAEPLNASRPVIIGIHGNRPWPPVMTKPCAVTGSALMTWMLTRTPARTVILGLIVPAMRKVSPGPPAGLASRTAPAVMAKMLQVNPVAPQIVPFGRYGRSPARGRHADH